MIPVDVNEELYRQISDATIATSPEQIVGALHSRFGRHPVLGEITLTNERGAYTVFCDRPELLEGMKRDQR